jgi:NADH-quinone oxidoreductase subunit I
MTKKTVTAQYPDTQPELPPRTRGVIGLFEENCTVCMLCARECPDWCIYIDSHKETVPAAAPGGRERSRNVLDRFAIDFSLCMYCGICVEVCPFDALFWSPEFEYAEVDIRSSPRAGSAAGLDVDRAAAARTPAAESPRELTVATAAAAAPTRRRRPARTAADLNHRPPRHRQPRHHQPASPGAAGDRSRGPLPIARGGRGWRRPARGLLPEPGARALWLVVTLGALAGCYLLLTAELVAWVQVLIYVGAVVVLLLFGLMLTRAPIGYSAGVHQRQRWVAAGVAGDRRRAGDGRRPGVPGRVHRRAGRRGRLVRGDG